MIEAIFWWIIILTTACGVIFTYGIVEDLVRQWRRKQENKTRMEPTNSPRSAGSPSQPTAPKPVVRGYDSPDLFRKDALIRIRKLEAEIATELMHREKARPKSSGK